MDILKNKVDEKEVCPHCTEEISKKASRCPHCHGKIYRWTTKKTVIVIFFTVIVIVLVSSNSSDNTNSNVKNNSQVVTQEPIVKISAMQIVDDYVANEVSADAEYKDKIVEVTGIIKSIGKDIMDDPYITLDGSSSITDVQCMFSKENQNQLVSLTKDTRITLRGKVSGKLMNVLVRGCSIVK